MNPRPGRRRIQLLRIDPGFGYRNLIAMDVGVRADPAALAAARTPEERQQVLAAARSRAGDGAGRFHFCLDMTQFARVSGVG